MNKKIKLLIIPYDSFACGNFRIVYPFSVSDPRFDVEITKGITESDFTINEMLFDWCDVCLMQRPSDPKFERIVYILKQNKKKVIIEIDDLIPLPKTCIANPAYEGLKEGSLQSTCFTRMLNMADAVITSSDRLRRHYLKYNSNILVARNAINKSYSGLTYRNEYLELVNEHKARGQKIIYWGGGSSHFKDLLSIGDGVRVIDTVLERCPDATFALAGNVEFYNLFSRVPEEQKVWLKFIHADMENGTRRGLKRDAFHDSQCYPSIADIQICPLTIDEFNHSKTCLKALEAGYYKNALVASPVESYIEFNGLAQNNSVLAKSSSDWIDGLTKVIKDDEFRNTLTKQCELTCDRHYSLEKLSALRYDFINYIHLSNVLIPNPKVNIENKFEKEEMDKKRREDFLKNQKMIERKKLEEKRKKDKAKRR